MALLGVIEKRRNAPPGEASLPDGRGSAGCDEEPESKLT